MHDLFRSEAREETLVIQPIVGIGDMIWHLPWIRAIALHHNVTLCCKPTSLARSLFKDIPGITNFIDLERSMRDKKGKHDGFLGIFKLAKEFKKSNFNKCIILHSSWRYALSAKLAGIPKIAGYGKGVQKLWLNYGKPLQKEEHTKHFLQKVQIFFSKNRLEVQENFTLPVSDTARKAAKSHIPKDPYIVLGVSATEPLRRWPPNYFAIFLDLLSKYTPSPKVLLVGIPSDKNQIKAVLKNLDSSTPKPAVITSVPIDVTYAIIEQSIGYVGNDTSLANLCVCAQKNVIIPISKSNFLRYRSFLNPISCPNKSLFDTPEAMESILPTKVLETFTQVVFGKKK